VLKLIKWIFLFLPALIWFTFRHYHNVWWMENVSSIPIFILFIYLFLFVILVIFHHWLKAIASVIAVGYFSSLLLPSEVNIRETCKKSLSIVQFNLFYENPDVNQFINYLLRHPADLVIIQEVSQQAGDKLRSLDDIYPFYYKGHHGVGYSSNQMILSRYPVDPISTYHILGSDMIIRALWRVDGEVITLIIAHAPSPRTEVLWEKRNALIRNIEVYTELYPASEMIIVGDFNLSAASPRYNKLFPRFQSQPVASWPSSIKKVLIPTFTMIGIDHLWIKSDNVSRTICSRTSTNQAGRSDHRLVTTIIGM